MASFKKSRTIDAPPTSVWAVLSDLGQIASWTDAVDHSCLTTEQRTGVGAQRRVQSGPATLLETMVSWVPDKELSYQLEGLPKAVHEVTNCWTLEPGPNTGTTEATLTTTITPGPRPPHKLIAKGIGKVLGKASDQMLDGLAIAATPGETL